MKTIDKLKIINDFFKNKKYSYLKILNISKVSILSDFFIIVSFNNKKTLNVIEDELSDFTISNHIQINKIEGLGTDWIVIDLLDIIIHLYNDKDREYYNLEKLWGDAEDITNIFN